MMESTKEIDATILKLEQKHLGCVSLLDADVLEVGKQVKGLCDMIKSGNSTARMIKAMIQHDKDASED